MGTIQRNEDGIPFGDPSARFSACRHASSAQVAAFRSLKVPLAMCRHYCNARSWIPWNGGSVRPHAQHQRRRWQRSARWAGGPSQRGRHYLGLTPRQCIRCTGRMWGTRVKSSRLPPLHLPVQPGTAQLLTTLCAAANRHHILARGRTHLEYSLPRFGTTCATSSSSVYIAESLLCLASFS